jgi:TonB-linked SusC/RagA family outer membrane protein
MTKVSKIQALDLKGIVFALLLILIVGNNSFSYANQNVLEKTISLDMKNSRFKNVLSVIEEQAKVHFIYNSEAIDVNKTISISAQNRKLDLVLQELFQPLSVNYQARDNRILLKLQLPKSHQQNNTSQGRPDVLPVNRTISGTVTDDMNESLPGVSIVIKGTQNGVISDEKGNFTIISQTDNPVLVFSFVGYLSQEIAVGNESILNVRLQSDEKALEEVVVVGYGTEKKVNVVGSIATVSSKELTSSPVPNISNAMAGRMPGVMVQQRSGEPGGNAANILIRGKSTLGNNAPLVVVDGIQGRDLNSINMEDVASISVLKDAAAAIYGARAANGVILITTKSGNSNSGPVFNYKFYEGFQKPTQLPELASSYEYAEMIREVETYRGIAETNMTFSEEDISKLRSGQYPWTHPNTNWYKEALADRSSIRNHNFSVNGGSSSVNYYVSVGSMNEDGIYRNSGNTFGRINLKGRVDVQVNKYLNLGLDMNGSVENAKRSVKSSGNVFTSIIRNFPHKHAVFPGTDKPGPDIEYGDQPMVSASFEPGFDHEDKYRSNNILSAGLKVPGIENLKLDASYSYDKYFGKRKFFEKPFYLNDFDRAGYLAAGNTGVENGEDFIIPYRAGTVAEPRLRDTYSDNVNKSLNLRMSYQKTLGRHNLSGFVAYENAIYSGQGIWAFRRYFNSDQLPYLFAGGDAQKDNGGSAENDSRVNFISRISYNFDEKYLLQFGFRRDGSVRFSKESGRWGNFPSILAGWRISEYDWWKNSLGVIDEFKLKASWAKMGNDLVPAFQYLSSYNFGSGGVYGNDGVYSPALYLSGTPNPNITWEVANITNVGFESYFFNNRLSLEMDFFRERRSNILIKRNASVPQFTGLTLPDENFGIVDNKGFEMMAGYNGRAGDFSYRLNGSFSFVRNRIVEFDEPQRSVPGQVRTGKPQGASLLYKSIGVFGDVDHVNSVPHVPGARPGDLIIADLDGDGNITPDDRYLLSRTEDPEIMYGLSGNLSYKKISLTFLIQGMENSIRNVYSFVNQGTSGNYYKYDAVGRWTPTNTVADKPRAFDRVEEYWRQNYLTDYGFHKGGFARLKNVQIGYSLPEKITKALRIKHSELYVSGQNLFLIYNKNKISDPEVQNSQTYPLMSVFALGGNFSF